MPRNCCLGGKISAEGEEQPRRWVEELFYKEGPRCQQSPVQSGQGWQGEQGTTSFLPLTSMVQSLKLSTSVGAEINLDPFDAHS